MSLSQPGQQAVTGFEAVGRQRPLWSVSPADSVRPEAVAHAWLLAGGRTEEAANGPG